VLGKQGTHACEIVLPLHRLGERTLDLVAPLVAGGHVRQFSSRLAFGGTPDLERAFELPSRRVRDDRAGRVRFDAPAVELVDAPALVAVLEAVLLAPAESQDLDEPIGGELRDREEADLAPVLGVHDDAPHASAASAEVFRRRSHSPTCSPQIVAGRNSVDGSSAYGLRS
jgi:hypothetical protein